MKAPASAVFLVLLALCEAATSRYHPYRRHVLDCQGNPPLTHYSRPRPRDNGFRVRIEGAPESYEPEREYRVTLQSSLPASFRGFALRATSQLNSSRAAGSFAPVNAFTSRPLISCPHVITHVTSGKKTRVSAVWRAPPSGFGCVRISASVVHKGSIWFKDSGRLSLTICESSALPPPNEQVQCCACGAATYRMTFYGLWSPENHPKDYPAFSTHWSNVIGASHSPDYVIWDYGQYASEAVQKVAEWGWPNDVETEVRSRVDDVMSVIKTKAQWPAHEPRNLRSPPSDTFNVDTAHPLVSLLTMLGPSPDWNVGITKQSMCTNECGWAGERTYNLTPWDAGTDSGVSYMSPNSPTHPHEKIKPLTTSDHPQSPFYNMSGGEIPPVARVVITRLAIQGDQCGESERAPDVTEQHVREVVTSHETSPACMYMEWGDWSECEALCGWGIKTRNRQVKRATGTSACEATMEKEICKGPMKECKYSDEVTACLFSDWTTWSPCSATCGDSRRFRSRVLKWPSEPKYCPAPLKEMESCNLPSCATEGCTYTSWTRWMPCSVSCGFGRTIRKRFVLSRSPDGRVCTEPLMQNSQCMTSMSCSSDPGEVIPGCTYTPWSDWSNCPVTCGVGQALRKKLLTSSSSQNNTVACKAFFMENTKCMTSASCEADDNQSHAATCSYTDWSGWMPCSTTCGYGSSLRKRFLQGTDSSLICEGILMETSQCYNGPCDVQSSGQCNFMTWTPWMPCSVTCGKGETRRKRLLNQTFSAQGCDPVQEESNVCMVACSDVFAKVTSPPCAYSDWLPWETCNAPCGVNSDIVRKRMLRAEVSRADCPSIVMETRSCPVVPCAVLDVLKPTTSPRQNPNRCQVSNWQPWGECSATCGKRLFATRRRHYLDMTSSSFCDVKLTERRRCPGPHKCSGQDCVLSSWGSWSKCNLCRVRATGVQKRRRKVVIKPKRGGAKCAQRRERKSCLCGRSN